MRYALPALCAISLLAALPAKAALSGYYDSLEQINLILADSALGDSLRQAPIKSIEFEGTAADGTLEWEIDTESCSVSVFLSAHQPQSAPGQPMVGKTSYKVERISACD